PAAPPSPSPHPAGRPTRPRPPRPASDTKPSSYALPGAHGRSVDPPAVHAHVVRIATILGAAPWHPTSRARTASFRRWTTRAAAGHRPTRPSPIDHLSPGSLSPSGLRNSPRNGIGHTHRAPSG